MPFDQFVAFRGTRVNYSGAITNELPVVEGRESTVVNYKVEDFTQQRTQNRRGLSV